MSDDRMIIQMKGLTKAYGEKKAVDNLTLGIKRGEVFGLLGPNGAGKTTTTLMLLGLTEPTAGSAFIDGKNCTRDPLAVKKIVGYLPDSVGFYLDMTGRENLRFTGRLNGLGGNELEERINTLLERVGMTYAADQKTGTYSRGMRQRLGVADALIKDPKVVIMDEPTLGIDPQGVRDLMSLIRHMAEDDGMTVLISLIPLVTAEKSINSALVMPAMIRASVVLPTPGGPQKIIEERLSLSMSLRSTFPSPRRCV